MKRLFKKILYYSGSLDLLNKVKNKNTITVVLFHRVLPVMNEKWNQVDVEWTVTDVYFRDCLSFFNRHYNIINLQDIHDYCNNKKSLPSNALLVTFDDGWSDNYEFAMPILNEFSIKPVLFVTTNSIGESMLSWQETLYSAWRINILAEHDITYLSRFIDGHPSTINTESEIRTFIKKLQESGESNRKKIRTYSKEIADKLPNIPQMITHYQLLEIFNNGFSLGAHGYNHEPLTHYNDPYRELMRSFEHLSEMLPDNETLSMAFPHGRVTDELLSFAIESGYRFVFTGDEILNKIKKRNNLVLGRCNISQSGFDNNAGRLAPELLALHLFRKSIR